MLLAGNASGDWQHTVATNSLWLGSLAIAGFSPATISRRIPSKSSPPPRAPSTPSRRAGGHQDPDLPAGRSRQGAPPCRKRLTWRPDPASTL